MNKALAQLSPGERRFVVAVAVVLFLVVNIFWVWPHFSDFGDLRDRGQAADVKLANYQGVIQKADLLAPELRKMESGGASVPAEDQTTEFFRTVQAQAMRSGVQFIGSSRTTTRTNQFFLELIQTISVQATEKQLVDFLFNLGSGDSLIRARSLSVHPDQPRQQLNATITLIASYQKNPKAASANPTPKAITNAGGPEVPGPKKVLLPGAGSAASAPGSKPALTNRPVPPGNTPPTPTGTPKKK
jgi:hypothetical protein